MKQWLQNSVFFCSLLFFSPFLFIGIPANASDQAVIISVPGKILKEVIRDALPIPLESPDGYLEGDIVIDSLNDLRIKKSSIFLSGVVLGNNLTMNTRIADQDINLKLGSFRLPVTCELLTRFDQVTQVLYITPHFSKTEKPKNIDINDALITLLSAFNNKEYPVELDSLEPLMVRVGARNIPIKLEPMDIQLQKDLLVVKLKPKVYKTL